MSEPGDAPDPPRIRASDADRERVAEVIRGAVADGRLTLVEGDERQQQAYGAVHRDELVPITADLEPPAVAPSGPAPLARRVTGPVDRPVATSSVGVLSAAVRRGEWTPGRTHTAVAVMGSAELAFRDARLDDAGLTLAAVAIMGGVTIDLRGVPAGRSEVVIRAVTIMGGVEVVVDPDTTVHENGVGLMGAFSNDAGPPRRPDGPVVRVTGFAFWAGVTVTRKPLALGPGDDDRPALER